MTVSVNGTTGITFNDASTQNTAATGFGFKNRIINGAMMIDQRNAGASFSNVDSAFCLDRWKLASFDGSAQTGKFTVQQDAGAVTPPVGFSDYLGITSSASTTGSSSAIYYVGQPVEGLNVSDFAWGTASATPVTVSFWVRSSLTGTFGGSVTNSAQNYSYPFTFTISAANTWEQKSITIVGPTSGTWLTTNGVGLRLIFNLGTGSTFTGSAGSWSANTYLNATGATNILGTSGATFYITGVQLEKGSTATSFDYRPYGTELALCQRYYYKNIVTSDSHVFGCGVNTGTTNATVPVTFLVPMRASPTALETTGTAGNYDLRSASAFSLSGIPTFNTASTFGASVNCSTSGLTAGFASNLRSVTSTAFLAWSAEL